VLGNLSSLVAHRQVVPESAELIGRLKGRVKVKGNVLSTGLKWNAQS